MSPKKTKPIPKISPEVWQIGKKNKLRLKDIMFIDRLIANNFNRTKTYKRHVVNKY